MPKNLFLLWVLTSISAAAIPEAQIQIDGQNINSFKRNACDAPTAEVTIILPLEAAADTQVFKARIIAADKKDPNKTECPSLKESQSDKSGVKEFTRDENTLEQNFFLSDSHVCGKKGAHGSHVLCIYPKVNETAKAVAKKVYYFDTRIAEIIGMTKATAANGLISFEVATSSPVQSLEVCFGDDLAADTEPDKCPSTFKKETIQGLQVSLPGLDKSKSYNVKIRIKDNGDQEKWLRYTTDKQNFPSLNPATVVAPWDVYEGEGGELMYSCASSPHSADWFLLIAFLLILFYMRRRSIKPKNSFLLVFLLALGIFSKQGQAELGDLNMSILGSMYRPNLDSEAASSFQFYKSFFRRNLNDTDGPINPLIGFDLNMHLWDGFSIGMGFGYTYVSGRALKTDASNKPLADQPGDLAIALHMFQIRPQLTYALNHFVEHFPLFPYARAAFITQGYYFNAGEGASIPTRTNSKGDIIKKGGFRFGWSGALGLGLNLFFLDPGSVRSARSGDIFSNVYLISELAYQKIDSFGRPGYNFSPKDVMGTRLPLMWTFGLSFDLL